MPTRVSRLGARGLPPLSLGGSGGSKGSMIIHSWFGTNYFTMEQGPTVVPLSRSAGHIKPRRVVVTLSRLTAASSLTVHFYPILHHLAFGEADHVDARYRHLSSTWGDASEFALVGAAHGEAGRDLVFFGDHVLDDETTVRESGTACHEKLLVALEVHRVGAASKVEAEVA